MISLKKVALLLFVGVAVVSCNSKKKIVEITEEKTNKVLVQPGYVAPESTDAFTVDNALVDGDKLMMYVSYGGGCKSHVFKAFASNAYMKSMPPKLSVFIEHDSNEDMCKSIVKDTLVFDISTIKYPGKDKDYSVIFTINNWEGQLTYKY